MICSLCSPWDSQDSSQHHNFKVLGFQSSVFFMIQLPSLNDYWKKQLWLDKPLLAKSCLCFLNMIPRFVIAFLPRSKCLLISWLQSPSTVILGPKKWKSVTTSTFSPSVCHEVMGPNAMILVFWLLSFKPIFSLSSFILIKRLFGFSSLSDIRVVSSAYLGCWHFSQQSWFQLWFIQLVHSAYKLNKQGDNIQPCYVPFPIWNQSIVQVGLRKHSLLRRKLVEVMEFQMSYFESFFLSNLKRWSC